MTTRYSFKNPEMIIAASALIVSLITAFVSIYSAFIDRAYARSSVWPRIELARGHNTKSSFRYIVSNNGTGPALIQYARVTYDGEAIPMPDLNIGYLPQEASVFRKLTVADNIMAVLEMTKLTKGEREFKLESLLDEFNLHQVRNNNGDSLSGGERRRTEIARALAVDPKFILLDEPFAGVDPIAVEDIQSVVARLKLKDIGILITDHNVNETLSICDRAYLLIEGKIFKHGTAEELAEDDQVRRLYLGTNFELKRKDWIIEMGQKAR